MQKGGEGVQIACKIAYVLNGRPLVFSNIIFCCQICKFLVIFILFTCLLFRFALGTLANGQCKPRNVVAYQAIIEPYLLAWP